MSIETPKSKSELIVGATYSHPEWNQECVWTGDKRAEWFGTVGGQRFCYTTIDKIRLNSGEIKRVELPKVPVASKPEPITAAPKPEVITAAPKPEAITAPKLLKKAAELMEERGKQYDKPEGERSMLRCVNAFNAVTGQDLTEPEGWLLLQLLKDVRQFQNPEKAHQDSLEDCIAYAALKAESFFK